MTTKFLPFAFPIHWPRYISLVITLVPALSKRSYELGLLPVVGVQASKNGHWMERIRLMTVDDYDPIRIGLRATFELEMTLT